MGLTRTTGVAVGAVTALAAAFATGIAVAQPDQDRDPGQDRLPVAAGPERLRPAFALSDLSPAESCDELLDWYVERGVRRVTAWGWESPVYWARDSFGGVMDGAELAVSPQSSARGAASAPAPQRATSGQSGTNVQEVGVDEPDVVKTDGALLVRVQDGDLVTYDVTGAPERLGSLDLPGVRDPELLLVGDRVVVTGSARDEDDAPMSRLLVVDVADPADPEVVDDATYDTELVSARLHGGPSDGVVRVVLSSPLPDLDFVKPRGWLRGEESARDHNQDVVRESTIEDWLPSVTRDGDSEPLLGCEDVAIPEDGSGLGTLTVVGIDPAAPESWSVSGVATDSQLAYFSTDRMVLATSAWDPMGIWCGRCFDVGRPRVGDLPSDDGTSHLYSFALDGLETAHVASGQVDGAIRDRWSMDEAGGVLRLTVGPTNQTGNFNSVVTLEEDGDDLVEIGRVDKLGVNEDIQSVRWFDRLAFVVTFRQVDPLYAVDLTDPGDPRLLGKLKIPGFSEYLHPLGQHRLLGIGQDGRWSAQASVFNVSDLTDPRQVDVVSYRNGSVAAAGADPRQFTWLPDRRQALTVIASGHQGAGGRTGWVSVLTLDGGDIENRMVEVEYGEDVDAVRTVPLPGGRVLLVTGEDVSDFDL